MRPTVRDVLDASELVIIGNASAEFREVEGQVDKGQQVLDLVRAFGARVSNGNGYQGICW